MALDPFDNLLTSAVLRVLGYPEVMKLNFSFAEYQMFAHHYLTVKSNIQNSISNKHPQIRVLYRPHRLQKIGSYGGYEHVSNTLQLPFLDFATTKQICTVIHECTHASHDLRSLSNMRGGVTEAMSFLAEAIFARLRYPGLTYKAIFQPDNKEEKTYPARIAYDLAPKVMGSIKRLSEKEEISLLESVQSFYKKVFLQKSGFNG